MPHMLIDCDTGIDDSFALAYAAAHPDITIAGVVSTGGNTTTSAVHSNNLAWRELLGFDAPVACGSDHPLRGSLQTAEDTHGPRGVGDAQLPWPADAVAAEGDAPRIDGADLWIAASRQHAGQLVGLVLGPSTNLARAIERDGDLAKRLARVVIMSGALNHRGNTMPTTEWNAAGDPEALKCVIDACERAGTELVLAPLDATEQVVLYPDHIQGLLDRCPGSRVASELAAAARFYFAFHEADGLGYLGHFHDPFVTALAASEQFASTRRVCLDVELDGTLTRGQTVADWLGRWGRDPNVSVVHEPDASRFLTHYVDIVSRWVKDTGR